MNKKKQQLIHKGARVRVADPLAAGEERWTQARTGTVTRMPKGRPPLAGGGGVQVLLDGEEDPQFVAWSDVDVEQKPRGKQRELPLSLIRPSRWQYRRRFEGDKLVELAKSIEEHGLINPPLVFLDEDGENYELIAGERRVRAAIAIALHQDRGDVTSLAKAVELTASPTWWSEHAPAYLAGLDDAWTVRCEVRPGRAADYREIVILENLQRQDPGAIEEAEAFQVLIQEEGYTQTQLAKRLGKSQAYVSQRLGLLDLAEEVRDTVQDQEISFTAARAIATLPESVQPAITVHVQELVAQEGESKATTRKVQSMTRQVRKFLELEAWDPPEDQVITPTVRNRLRLIQYHIAAIDHTSIGPAIIALRRGTRMGRDTNYTGKKPLSIAGEYASTGYVVSRLTGRQETVYNPDNTFWREVATAQEWDCQHCQFSQARRPEMYGVDPLCARWALDDDDGETIPTCINFVGPDDPIVLPLEGYDAAHWAEKTGHQDALRHADTLWYLDDFEQFVIILEDIAVAKADETAQRERAERERHLPNLRSYWEAQADSQTSIFGIGLASFQAHRCTDCAHYREDLLQRDLPPCHFAVEPLRLNKWSDKTRPPGMGVLVQMRGYMVSRCEMFRYREIPDIARAAGMAFSEAANGRHDVMNWLHEIAKHSHGEHHYNTLPGVLAWLPYKRSGKHDLNAMIDYIRRNWDELGGDEAIATLLSVALSEVKASQSHHNPFELRDANTRARYTWAAIRWDRVMKGDPAPSWLWPDDWPQPWVKETPEE